MKKMFKRKSWLVGSCLMISATLVQPFAQEAKKPNILFIAVDDLKPELGCYGNTLVKSPNIDRLAKMGTVFYSNYCQQAVCGPTRASLMSGLRPDVTKIWDLRTKMRDVYPDILTLPQHLIAQGYTTSGVGKIYHPGCIDRKMDELSWSIPYIKPSASDYANGLGEPVNKHYQSPEMKALFSKADVGGKGKNDNGDDEGNGPSGKKGTSTECLDLPDNAYEDGVSALLGKQEMIELYKKGKPFFMAVGYHKPHLPFVAPKKYWDLYNREDMPLAKFQEHSKDGPDIAYHNSNELRAYTDIPEFASFSDGNNHIGIKPEKQKQLIHGYYAAVSYMDAQVGILLNTLDSLGILKNTIIVLWGDHGWHLGDHDLWNKHTNFEQATRSPLIIAAPGYKGGQTTKSISEHVDIFPTICNLAGVNIPTQLQGKSLVPLMKDKKASVKEYAISQYPRKLKKEEVQKLGYTDGKIMGYALRTDKYRYILWTNNNFTTKQPFTENRIYTSELYDYTKDPLETVNVANDAKYASTVKDMKAKMLEYFKAQEGREK